MGNKPLFMHALHACAGSGSTNCNASSLLACESVSQCKPSEWGSVHSPSVFGLTKQFKMSLLSITGTVLRLESQMTGLFLRSLLSLGDLN